MKRYFRIFFLYSQLVFEIKSISVVWFFVTIIGSILMLIFWSGATASQGGSVFGWTYSNFATYYLLIALAGLMLIAHIEGDIAIEDINKGDLSLYLLKPISYYGIKFFDELAWRILQGILAIITLTLIGLFTTNILSLETTPITFFLAVVISLFAYLISFTFKMCLGLLAFWLTEINSVMEISDIILAICGGIVIPLALLPSSIKLLFDIFPFSYMIYYPVVALLGKLDTLTEIKIIFIQLIWLFIFGLLYKFMWKKGRLKFTAVGR